MKSLAADAARLRELAATIRELTAALIAIDRDVQVALADDPTDMVATEYARIIDAALRKAGAR